MGRLRLAILGSTGSIGRQALDVAERNPERIEVVALAANSNASLLAEQARAFGVARIALADPEAAAAFNASVAPGDPFVAAEAGPGAVVAMADAATDGADVVLNALVGAAGLRASLAAVRSGATLALANKESLVVGGELIMPLVEGDRLLPVDSEHSAIFQCLLGEGRDDVAKIWLTASGGPFRSKNRAEIAEMTTEQALAHPTWNMGPKITIDSATLMNKGLEVIEAHHLFAVGYDDIRIVVHPQSCVHSMVEYRDGSVKAHLGATDMRIPIQYALSYPRRWEAPLAPVDFTTLGALEFLAPDTDTFGCLRLAIEAGKTGGTAPAVLNAANEVAVAAFLGGRLGFLGIEWVVEQALEALPSEPVTSLEQLEATDAEARRVAAGAVEGAAGS